MAYLVVAASKTWSSDFSIKGPSAMEENMSENLSGNESAKKCCEEAACLRSGAERAWKEVDMIWEALRRAEHSQAQEILAEVAQLRQKQARVIEVLAGVEEERAQWKEKGEQLRKEKTSLLSREVDLEREKKGMDARHSDAVGQGIRLMDQVQERHERFMELVERKKLGLCWPLSPTAGEPLRNLASTSHESSQWPRT